MNIKFIKTLKKLGKVVGAAALALVLASQVISAPNKTSADAPRFNFLDNDMELISAANATKNETVYTDPISAENGDQVVGLVYYHNGVIDTTAKNTKIKVTMPSAQDGKDKFLTASLGADNAETVTDTIVNGKVVGKSGLTVLTDAANSKLEFVPGSVKWFPNKGSVAVTLPNGQTGDEIIGNGINIGDINGCWQYSGFVTFVMKVKTPELKPQLDVNKLVKNASVANSTFVKNNEAKPGDQLDYKIILSNPGDSTTAATLVKDTLPAGVSFVAGSAKYYPDRATTSVPFPFNQTGDTIVTTGVNLGGIGAGDDYQSEIVFSVKVNTSGVSNNQTLVNTVSAVAGSLSDSDTASTIVKIEAKSPCFELSKSAFNLTQNVDAQSKLANPGDTIKYTLVTKNTGNGAGNIEVKDGIADVLEEADLVDNGGGQIINLPNEANSDNTTTITYGTKTLAPGQENVSTFTIKVKNPLPTNPASGTHYDNVMYNIYGNKVIIKIQPPVVNPVLSIVKNVRNVTTNEIDFTKSDTAIAGDTLEYQIVIANTGNASADGIKLVDILPVNVGYLTGTTVLVTNGVSRTVLDGISANGITFNQFPAGATYTIYLRAKIDSGVAVGSTLTNTANLVYDNKTLSDQAVTTTKAPVVLAATPKITSLPRTGANTILASIMLAVFGVSNLVYFRGKKKIAQAMLLS